MAVAELQIIPHIPGLLDKNQAQLSASLEDNNNMVQVFMVVRCYSCKTFQVHQVKKINKWVCTICNEKQSVLKTYGKGSGKECRKHVQKLNLLRAERERARTERRPSEEGEKCGEVGEKQHPPGDYPNTFTITTSSSGSRDVMEHPVILADNRKSKWTTYIKPEEEEDEDEPEDHTSRTEGKRRKSSSFREPRPQGVAQDKGVSPYSSMNQDMLMNSKSMFFHPDRYTKLEHPHYTPTTTTGTTSTSSYSLSMCDLSSLSPGKTGQVNHRERMMQIKQDLKQFSRANSSKKTSVSPGTGGEERILSSRWSQFMCEDDSEEEKERDKEDDFTTHILTSKSTIAKFTL